MEQNHKFCDVFCCIFRSGWQDDAGWNRKKLERVFMIKVIGLNWPAKTCALMRGVVLEGAAGVEVRCRDDVRGAVCSPHGAFG